MREREGAPTLLRVMFGQAAELAVKANPSERMMWWCQAFEDWMEFRKKNSPISVSRSAYREWKRLLSLCGKPPWEVSTADVDDYSTWLTAEGLEPNTIYGYLDHISSFYHWCIEHGGDPDCEPDFNPVSGAARPMKENYKRARILSRDEAQALLNIYRQDRWVLSKRDFAFFTCRLRMGIPTTKLCKLKWGQIWEDKSGHWIDLGRERLGVPLDMEAWEAIEDYLRASGRLSAERRPAPEAYVFAHLINPLPGSMGSKAEEWNERRFVECRAWGKYLRIYGRLVGIMPEKLTLPTLRYTALAWRLEAGDDVEQMHAMMGSKNYATTRTYRSRIRKVVRRGYGAPFTKKEPAFLPNRDRFKFRSEDRFNKRYLSGSIPPEELTAMLAENIEGLDVEIQGLRILERRLLDDQIRTDDRDEVMALMDMATRTTVWLATLIDTERSLKERRPEDK